MMNLNESLEHVAVIGAGGKMGSGIALLLAQEMAKLKCTAPDASPSLVLIDPNPDALDGVRAYIEKQTTRLATKKIDLIRPLYKHRTELDSDEAISAAFVAEVLSLLKTSTELSLARDARLVFEVIPERADLKISTFKELKAICGDGTVFLSNTSSLPIEYLDREAGLNGRIIGFHFYNPPAIQKLVELIPAATTLPKLTALADQLGKRLGKLIVPTRDIAGFIGNGYFIRDGQYAINEAARLQAERTLPGAIYALNQVSQIGLVRPMGIFQLLDYVGLDVFHAILTVMTEHLPGQTFHADLIDTLTARGVCGGQHADGTQKDGIFQYADNRPAGVYSLDTNEYLSFADDPTIASIHDALGELAAPEISWKALMRDDARMEKLSAHFAAVRQRDTWGATLTRNMLQAFRSIGELLVTNGVAATSEDVDAVIENGFFHLYGPFQKCVLAK